MIDYDNKEERKILEEALAKYFPLDSIKIVRQSVSDSTYSNPLVSAKEYFDKLTGIYGGVTLVVKGKFDWMLCIDVGVVSGVVRLTRIYNNTTNYSSNISYCSLDIDSWDPFDIIANLFNCRRPEYRLAKHLFKLAKAAYIRISKYNMANKIKALKEDLL